MRSVLVNRRFAPIFCLAFLWLIMAPHQVLAEPDNWVVSGVASNDRLNVRSAPNADAETLGRLRNGTRVRNLGCKNSGGARWCRISADTVRGWVNGRFLREAFNDDQGEDEDQDRGTQSGGLKDVKCKENPRECLRKARRSCDGEYRVIYSDSHAGGLVSDKVPGPVTWYYLQYKCGRSGGTVADFRFRGDRYNPDSGDDFDDDDNDRDGYGSDSGSGNAVRMQDMQRFCRGEASAKFKQRPQDIATLPVENVADGYVVYGQYPQTGNDVTTFQCKFNQSRVFRRVNRN
jgi:hypothetical protein